MRQCVLDPVYLRCYVMHLSDCALKHRVYTVPCDVLCTCQLVHWSIVFTCGCVSCALSTCVGLSHASQASRCKYVLLTYFPSFAAPAADNQSNDLHVSFCTSGLPARSVCLSVCLSVYMFVCLFVLLCLYVCLCLCVCLCCCVYLFVCLSACLYVLICVYVCSAGNP